ncbi:alpha/beta hydrolase [Bremerella sp. JC817]|uniref:alpha/beta fold hydrolase n=1 Tax=Bremerella sp. JC817 TaxID=3231756 RepID=UPI00345A42DB
MQHTIKVNDTAFQVHTDGAGSPLVLVHGFPMDHHMWDSVVPMLAQQHTVITPDLRGFGGSGGFCEIATMERFADDLVAILDQMDITEPITFAGLSMGGYIGWQMWKRHADRLARLILLDTRAAGDDEIQARARRVNAEGVLENGMSGVPAAMLPKLLSEATREHRPDVVAMLTEIILRQDPRGVAAAQRGMAQRADVTAWLSEIDLPVLVLCGEADSISPVAEMRGFANQLPEGQFVVIPAAGHMPPVENPAATSDAILAFCQGLPA